MIEKFVSFSCRGRNVLLLFVATQIVYVVMVAVTLPHISSLAGGLDAFDMMPFGYDLDYASKFLTAIGTDGRSYYLTRQIPLDLLYPGLFMLSYAALWLWLQSKMREPTAWLRLGALLAVAAGACDYVENAFIATMLTGFPDLSGTTVQLASFFALVKSMGTTVYFVCLLILAAAVVIQRLRTPKT